MFILNFQELLDPSMKKGGIKQRMTHSWLQAGACPPFVCVCRDYALSVTAL